LAAQPAALTVWVSLWDRVFICSCRFGLGLILGDIIFCQGTLYFVEKKLIIWFRIGFLR
jgi:hypothetical protein